MEIQNYINRLFETIFPSQKVVKKEKFEGESVPTSSMGGIALVLTILIGVVLSFMYSYGAAKLSWHYNVYIGNGSGSAFVWSLLAFFFSGFYYPFYAIFLNPLASIKRPNIVSVGGRRR